MNQQSIDSSGGIEFQQAAVLAAEALRIMAREASDRRSPVLTRRPGRQVLDNPSKVAQRVAFLNRLKKEHVIALYVNARNRELQIETVSIGTLTASLIHPREVFGPALRCSAAGVLIVHNHPSGEPDPSPEDKEITRRLVRAGEILGIPMIDHIIVSEGGYYSFREHGLL